MCTRPGASDREPKRAPVRGAELPRQPEDLGEAVEPILAWSKIGGAESRHARLCANKEGPNETFSMTGGEDTKSTRERPVRSAPEPDCAGLLTKKEESKTLQSNEEIVLASQLKDLAGIEKPGQALSETSREEQSPKRDRPITGATGSM